MTRAAPAIACAAAALAACASPPPERTPAGLEALTPVAWQRPAAWSFEVVSDDQAALGRVVLLFTADPLPSGPCGGADWHRAVLLEERLDVDLGMRPAPAWRIEGPWLTVDLTAASCSSHHRFVGELDGDGASGFFNHSHPLGGRTLGRFRARPAPTWP